MFFPLCSQMIGFHFSRSLVFFCIFFIGGAFFLFNESSGPQLDVAFQSPGFSHGLLYSLGADSLGRPLLERSLVAFFISWALGLGAASLALFLGLFLGILMGLWRGWFDLLMMRLIEALDSLPTFMILVLWILVWMGESGVASIGAYFWLVVGMGLLQWRQFARIAQNEVVAEGAKLYVEAALATGVSPSRLIWHHLFPNIWPQVRIQFWVSLPSFVMGESVVSFLGFGLQPPLVSLGTLLSEGWAYFSIYPHLMLVPGLMLCFGLLSLQFATIRPRSRGR